MRLKRVETWGVAFRSNPSILGSLLLLAHSYLERSERYSIARHPKPLGFFLAWSARATRRRALAMSISEGEEAISTQDIWHMWRNNNQKIWTHQLLFSNSVCFAVRPLSGSFKTKVKTWTQNKNQNGAQNGHENTTVNSPNVNFEWLCNVR